MEVKRTEAVSMTYAFAYRYADICRIEGMTKYMMSEELSESIENIKSNGYQDIFELLYNDIIDITTVENILKDCFKSRYLVIDSGKYDYDDIKISINDSMKYRLNHIISMFNTDLRYCNSIGYSNYNFTKSDRG